MSAFLCYQETAALIWNYPELCLKAAELEASITTAFTKWRLLLYTSSYLNDLQPFL